MPGSPRMPEVDAVTVIAEPGRIAEAHALIPRMTARTLTSITSSKNSISPSKRSMRPAMPAFKTAPSRCPNSLTAVSTANAL